MRSFVDRYHGGLAFGAAQAKDLTVERLFDAPDLQGPSLRQTRFSPDGKLVSYLRGRDDAPAVFDLWAYDIAAKTHRLLVDSRLLSPAEETLSAEEEARRERQRIAALRGIVEYQWSPDSRSLLVPLGGDLYHYDLSKPAAAAVRRLTADRGFETDPKFSPRGRYVSFIRDQDLYAVEVATGAERRLTTGGGGLDEPRRRRVRRRRRRWTATPATGGRRTSSTSPIARVDESPVDEVERFEIDAGGVRVLKQRYPATGRPNAEVHARDPRARHRHGGLGCDLGQKDVLPRARRVVPGEQPPAGAAPVARPEAARRSLFRHRRRAARSFLGAQRHLGGRCTTTSTSCRNGRKSSGPRSAAATTTSTGTTTAAC